jgi:hypothetical protein
MASHYYFKIRNKQNASEIINVHGSIHLGEKMKKKTRVLTVLKEFKSNPCVSSANI